MQVNNIIKKFDNKVVFDKFSYNFADDKITVVMGNSGIGKTTLLNIIAGLTEYNGEVQKQSLSYIFQNDRLLPNLTVADNLKLINKDIDVSKCLSLFGLENCENLYPCELSAGMSRRVAIIRGLMYDSKLILMDEPFRNLDYKIKYAIMDIIKEHQKNNPKTIILVTHDISECLYLADEIVVLDNPSEIKNKLINKNLKEKNILNLFLK